MRLIDADNLIEKMKEKSQLMFNSYFKGFLEAMKMVSDFPSANVQETKLNGKNEHADSIANEAIKEELENEYGKTYRDYAKDIVNQIMDYAESTHKAYPHHFTLQVLAEALHQITEDKIKYKKPAKKNQ